jgi:hypothetical protein
VKISSDQYVLFIGNGKIAKEQRSHMKNMFSKFGMTYGWLGRRAALTLDASSMTKVAEYKEFFYFMISYQPGAQLLIEEKVALEDKEIVEVVAEDVTPEVVSEEQVEETDKKVPKILADAGDFAVKVINPIKALPKAGKDAIDANIGGANIVKQGILKGNLFYMNGEGVLGLVMGSLLVLWFIVQFQKEKIHKVTG